MVTSSPAARSRARSLAGLRGAAAEVRVSDERAFELSRLAPIR